MIFGLPLDAALALLGTIIATVGVKFVERWISKRDRNTSDAAQIRSELRTELESSRAEIRRLESELDEWRIKYYQVMEELLNKRVELQRSLADVQKLTDQAKIKTQEAANILSQGVDRSSQS